MEKIPAFGNLAHVSWRDANSKQFRESFWQLVRRRRLVVATATMSPGELHEHSEMRSSRADTDGIHIPHERSPGAGDKLNFHRATSVVKVQVPQAVLRLRRKSKRTRHPAQSGVSPLERRLLVRATSRKIAKISLKIRFQVPWDGNDCSRRYMIS